MSDEEGSNRKRRRPPPDTFVASTRVTRQMMAAIDRVLESGNYLRVSDYLRDLIRKDLDSREMSLE